jgi:hypothetical protein
MLVIAACSDPSPPTAASGGSDGTAQAFQEVLGRLKLVKQEYAIAVGDGGVVDPVEYEESQMFAEQAALHYRRVRDWTKSRDPGAATGIESGLVELMKLVDGKRPVADANRLLDRLVEQVAAVSPSKIPPAVEGTRDAVARADAMITAEAQVSGYRIGVLSGPPRTLYLRRDDGSLAPSAPAAGATHYVAVVLREARTKRFLPGSTITARVAGGAPVELHHLWGEFFQYGANVEAPEGRFELEVTASPPAYCRHGDMLASFVKPATATFHASREGTALRFDGEKPAPGAPDYAVGDDVLQALGEARWKGQAGPYALGFIAEGPEPIWLWKNGRPELEPAAKDDTNHLEIALMDRSSMRIIPEGDVRLTLERMDVKSAPVEVELHPLLSSFYHYGKTLRVPAGRYRVTVRAEPPRFGALQPGAFVDRAEATFEWDNQPRIAAARGG